MLEHLTVGFLSDADEFKADSSTVRPDNASL